MKNEMENIFKFRNDNGKKFLEWSHGLHDVKKFCLWSSLPDDEIQFPLRNAKIHVTAKQSMVLVPSETEIVYLLKIRSGYRGDANFLEFFNCSLIAQWKEYDSGAGALGETAFALVQSDQKFIEFKWKVSGRRLSNYSGTKRVFPDGKTEDILEDEELMNILGVTQ
jgi:hypothetical protein